MNPARPHPAPGGGEVRRLRLLLEYRGTAFHGWQVQPGLPTVQGILEETLAVLCRHPVRVHGAGRTDAGVHALGQVAHFDTSAPIPTERLAASLAGMLPDGLTCLQVAETGPEFEARGSASGKVYRYRILNRRAPPVLDAGLAWHVSRPLDVGAMRRALGPLLGRHDFSAYRAADCQNRDPVKELRRVEVGGEEGGPIHLEFEGSGFLKQMVRNLVGTAVEVGGGRRPPEEMVEVLRGRDRTRAGATAPAHGLYLARVLYPAPWAGPPSPRPRLVGAHHLALKVRDVEGVAAFWARTLALPVVARHLFPDGSLRSIWLDAGILLMVERSGVPGESHPARGPFAADPPGYHLLALRAPATDRAPWMAHLTRSGVAVEGRTGSTLYLRDPEGNRIGLSCWPATWSDPVPGEGER